MAELEKIKNLSWQEVFEIWRKNEEKLPHWVEFLKKKGYASWEAWRKQYADTFKLDQLDWSLYKINNPKKTIPHFSGGPFKMWEKHFYEGENMPTFEKIIKNPKIKNYDAIKTLAKNFPKQTTLIGFKTEKGIVIVEGMHRCTAITKMVSDGTDLDTEIRIALSEYDFNALIDTISF